MGKDFRNLNFVLKSIYKHSIKNGPVEKWTFNSFDGNFFRGTFIAFSNEKFLGFGGEAMKAWWRHDPTIAVFANKEDSKKLRLVNTYGEDVSNKNEIFEHESFNNNPSNDAGFVNS